MGEKKPRRSGVSKSTARLSERPGLPSPHRLGLPRLLFKLADGVGAMKQHRNPSD